MTPLAFRILRGVVLGVLGLVVAGPTAWGWVTGQLLVEVDGGSMSPALGRGDLILVDTAVSAPLERGDVVTARGADGRLVTHRIVEVRPDGSLTTRGDANPVPDADPVSARDVVGVVVLGIPQPVAGVIAATQSLPGRISLGAVIAGLLLLPSIAATRAAPETRTDVIPAADHVRDRPD